MCYGVENLNKNRVSSCYVYFFNISFLIRMKNYNFRFKHSPLIYNVYEQDLVALFNVYLK